MGLLALEPAALDGQVDEVVPGGSASCLLRIKISTSLGWVTLPRVLS